MKKKEHSLSASVMARIHFKCVFPAALCNIFDDHSLLTTQQNCFIFAFSSDVSSPLSGFSQAELIELLFDSEVTSNQSKSQQIEFKSWLLLLGENQSNRGITSRNKIEIKPTQSISLN